ncbi:MAG: hypothetical protein ACM33T_07015 [Solirubrobacterales bacterium]
MRRLREILAAVLAGILAVAPFAVIGVDPSGGTCCVWALIWGAAAAVSVPTTLIVGLPVHWVLQSRRWTSYRLYALAGALCGGVGMSAVYLVVDKGRIAAMAPFGAFAGLLVALVFRVILGRFRLSSSAA